MLFRKAVLFASFALSAAALPALAQTVTVYEIDVAPPAARVETIPPARSGYTWAPGYWKWEEPRRTHVWSEGRYIESRDGYRWTPDRWVQRDRRYSYEAGRWDRINTSN